MGNEISFLITFLSSGSLIKCALKVNRDKLTGDCAEYPREPENIDQLLALLPDHVQSCGPIVEIESIFEVHCA